MIGKARQAVLRRRSSAGSPSFAGSRSFAGSPSFGVSPRTPAASGLQAFISEHRDAVLSAWRSRVVAVADGRSSDDRLAAWLVALLDAVVPAWNDGQRNIYAAGYESTLGLLTEMSVAFARSGFTATETAICVFGLRDAVIDALARNNARAEYADEFLEFSLLVEGLALFRLTAAA